MEKNKKEGVVCVSPGLRVLERQMQQPPGYRPRGYGIPYSEIERVDFDDTDIIIEHGDTVLSITLGEDAEDERYPRYMYNFIMDILDYE